MEDFLELGLEASDRIVDGGFHKLPDRVFDPLGHHKTDPKYRQQPKMTSQQSNNGRSNGTDRHRRSEDRDRRRYDDGVYSDDEIVQYDPYPNEDIRSRRYPASTRGGASRADLYGPPSRASTGTEYMPPSHRPRLQHRRSRSVQPSTADKDYDSVSRRPRSSHGHERYDDEDKLPGRPRKKSLAMGALGAAAGGLLANQAGRATGRATKREDEILLTLAGIVLGGLGATALENVAEKKKRLEAIEQEAWEKANDKDGDGRADDSDGDGSARRRARRVWGDDASDGDIAARKRGVGWAEVERKREEERRGGDGRRGSGGSGARDELERHRHDRREVTGRRNDYDYEKRSGYEYR